MIPDSSLVVCRWSFAIKNWANALNGTPAGTLLAASDNVQQTHDSIEGRTIGAN
jgi:hypothetical protein